MKKFLSALYRVMCHIALSFTAVLLFFWSFMDNGNNAALAYENITEFFKFSLIFGASSLISFIPKLPSPLKTLIHFVINTVSFVVFFTLSHEGSQSAKFIAIIIFVVIYVVVSLAAALIRRVSDKKVVEEAPAADEE